MPRKYCGFAGLASKSHNDKNSDFAPKKAKPKFKQNLRLRLINSRFVSKTSPKFRLYRKKQAQIHALTLNNKALNQALPLKALIKATLSKALIAVKASFKAPVFACFAEFLLQDIAAIIDK